MNEHRTELVKSGRTDRETFYFWTMSADLCKIINMGAEMTEQEVLECYKKLGRPEFEALAHMEQARTNKQKQPVK